MNNITQDFLAGVILRSPETGDMLGIISVRGHEEGLDHLEITVGNDKEKWKHMIRTEEMP